jgi:hypothetical protein
MTHPLFTFLRNPIAAPEALALRRMRNIWMALCWSLTLAVLLLLVFKASLGPWAALPALLLALAVPLLGLVHFRAKSRLDDAFGREARP